MRSMVALATFTCLSVSATDSDARWVCSTFLRVMEARSCPDAEVSSSEAACSEEACARDWLTEATCVAAAATCEAPSDIVEARSRSTLVMLRTITTMTAPTARHTRVKMTIIHCPVVAFDLASSLAVCMRAISCCTSCFASVVTTSA